MLPSTNSSSDEYEIRWPDPHVHPHRIQETGGQALVSFQSSPSFRCPASQDLGEDDALIVPVIQAGQFNVREEEQHLSHLFACIAAQRASSSSSRPLIDLTSGYFGLYRPYQDLILNSHADCSIVCASPEVSYPALYVYL
jgi:CDP-diacylglycerol---glycerol-3-phosphate 3-phosphatidyltransferase